MRAQRLKELREERGFSIRGLARRAGLNPTTVYTIESGRNANPELRTLEALATALGVAVTEFLREPVLK